MNQANQRWRMEKCVHDQVLSFIAEVPESFLKQFCISNSQHLSQLVVLFSAAFISACPSCILSLCVFLKLLRASVVLILMGKIGLLSWITKCLIFQEHNFSELQGMAVFLSCLCLQNSLFIFMYMIAGLRERDAWVVHNNCYNVTVIVKCPIKYIKEKKKPLKAGT